MAQRVSTVAGGPVPTAVSEKIFSYIDEAEACQLALDLCAIPSSTGEEGPVAEFMLDWFARQGITPVRQDVEDGRLNAVGIVRGSGKGTSLMFNGHLDTGGSFYHEELVGAAPIKRPVIAPRLENGVLWGTGMDNMKSAVAAFMLAAQAIKRSGVRLRGDLILAGVCGEIGRAPVDQYQGRWYRSKGVGTRYLLNHGIVSDYAIVADCSHFTITWAECGVMYVKITTQGTGMYTPFTKRPADPRQTANAFIKMLPLVEAFERWAAEYERTSIHPVGGPAGGGEVHPKASIGSVMAGAPFRVSNTPLNSSIYADIRTPPNKLPIDILRDLDRALAATGVEYTLDPYLTQRGYENEGVEPLVAAVRESYRFIAKKDPTTVIPAETSMWNDTNLYHEAGIPTIKFGIGGVVRKLREGERWDPIYEWNTTSVDDLITLVKTNVATTLAMCGLDG